MKFIISTSILNQLVSKCYTVISAKPTTPVLSNFLVEAIDNQIIITSTDLMVGIRCCGEAKVLEEGGTTLPAKTLVSLIKELDPNSNVEFTTNSNDLTENRSGGSKFKLRGMSRLEYPALPSMNEAKHFQVSQKDLKSAFFTTSFAVSRDESRYILTGVNICIEGAKATFVGTDGKRLARSFFETPFSADENNNYTIPVKAVDELLKALGDEGNVDVYLMHDKIALQTKNILIVSKLLSGDFLMLPALSLKRQRKLSLFIEKS